MGVPRPGSQRSTLWTGVVLLTLSYGVQGLSTEELPAYLPPEHPADSALLAFFRKMYEEELLKQMVQQQLQQPPETEIADLTRSYEPMPLPLALHVGDVGSRETDKRASSSYMALCHFKICSVGRKRSSLRRY